MLRLANAGEDATLDVADGRLIVIEDAAVRAVDPRTACRATRMATCSARRRASIRRPRRSMPNGQGIPYAVYGYGAHLAEVEVDSRLGTVKVLQDHGRT